ncbi:MAG: hypothetical protein WBP26_01840 [Candidatus Saccharimonadales bacterium]
MPQIDKAEAVDISLVSKLRSGAMEAVGKLCTAHGSVYHQNQPGYSLVRDKESQLTFIQRTGLAGVSVIVEDSNLHILHTSDNHIKLYGPMAEQIGTERKIRLLRFELPPPGQYDDTMIYDITIPDRCTPESIHPANYNPLLDGYLRLLEATL